MWETSAELKQHSQRGSIHLNEQDQMRIYNGEISPDIEGIDPLGDYGDEVEYGPGEDVSAVSVLL